MKNELKRSLQALWSFLEALWALEVDGFHAFLADVRLALSLSFWISVYMLLVHDTRNLHGLYDAGAADVPASITVMEPAVGLGDIIKAGLGFLFVGIFSIVILAVLGQFAAISSIWPTANVTKITTNIANSVVTGTAFLSILVVLIMVGFIFVTIGLLQALIS